MAENWIKFHEGLRAGFWHGVPRAYRFVFLELCHEAKRLDGVVELPHGAKDHIDGIAQLLGGNTRETRRALRFLITNRPKTIEFTASPGGRQVLVRGWSRHNPTCSSAERVRKHRAKNQGSRPLTPPNVTPGPLHVTVTETPQSRVEERRVDKIPPTPVTCVTGDAAPAPAADGFKIKPTGPKAKPKRPPAANALSIFWEAWLELWAAEYGSLYVRATSDQGTMKKLSVMASDHAKNPRTVVSPGTVPVVSVGSCPDRVRSVATHWIGSYLADADQWIVDKGHPLKHLGAQLSRYGLPWGPKPRRRSPGPSEVVTRPEHVVLGRGRKGAL